MGTPGSSPRGKARELSTSARARAAAEAGVPLLVLALLLQLRGHVTLPRIVAGIGLAFALFGFLQPRLVRRAGRVLRRGAGRVAHVIGLVLYGAIDLLLVTPVAAIQRLLKVDPLDRGVGRGGTSWYEVEPNPYASRGFAREVRGTRRRHVRVWVAAVVVMAAVGGGVIAFGQRAETSPPALVGGYPYSPYAHQHEPFAKALFAEQAANPVLLYDIVTGFRNEDYDGTLMHVRDRVRASYTPEAPTYTVWFFGGSALFGIGQRDDRTIPSMVVRNLEQRGLKVKAVNFGASAFVNWQETQLLAYELTKRSSPDLVVFYDGPNDLGMQYLRNTHAVADPSDPGTYLEDEYSKALAAAHLVVTPPGKASAVDDQALARRGAALYAKSQDLVHHLADAYGFKSLWFWQPDLRSKANAPADREVRTRMGLTSADSATVSKTYGLMRTLIPDPPIDLTHSLDGVRVPVYTDFVHTNELGAATVAGAMVPTIEAALRSPR